MLEIQLRQQLSKVALRLGRLWMWRRLTWSWAAFAVLVALWAIAGRPFVPGSVWFFAALLVATVVWIQSRYLGTSKVEVARNIEQAFPELNSRLLAALEQFPEVQTGRLNVLQRQVISEAVHHARMNDWTEAVPPRQMRRAILNQTAAMAAFVIVGLMATQGANRSAAAISSSDRAVENVAGELPVTVEPGDAELERGSSLLVLARFQGTPPADVHVIWKGEDGNETRLALAKSLDDPVFASRLPVVKEDISYRIDFDGNQTKDYRITVYDLPALVRSDLSFEYPSYTQLPANTLEDAFDASVVEGTRISITCHVNKSLVSARLVSADGTTLTLEADPDRPQSYRCSFIPEGRVRLKLELTDDAGRKNRDPEEFRIDVVPNRAPDLKLVFPGKDVKVSPLEEVALDATAIDDFGLLEVGLVVQMPGREPVTLPLGRELSGGQQHKLSSLQRLEDFRVQPDELMTYYLYADDFGPDGQRRRTNGDVFFAEVRAFDEIYRQVDQQGAGEMQNSQKPPESLAKLLELQKQIIVGTWKAVRTPDPTWSPKLEQEVQTLHEGQLQAARKLQALRERMTQPQLQPIFSTISDGMEKASGELERAVTSQNVQPLTPATAAEQLAYQGLLKLRAKEHLLMQSKAKGSGQQNEEKERLDLELKQSKDRYESEKTAKQQESNVNREALAILDRLKEMARRQEELNQQLKDLDAQARQAKTDADREEIERRLKRLREEQQQILHDTDELRNKLNHSNQQETVAETKQQLEQTRQRMVETAEKLREGQLSQALSAGTRAERELKQMQEDFRKQTAAQFADAMRSMREEVRQLAEREKELAQELAQLSDDSSRTLRQSQQRSQLQAEFQQQQLRANEIVDHAKQVVEESETSEPLLSRQLYDMLRSTRESKLDQALSATQQLLKQGILPEAAKAEMQAQAGIDQLKKGIEKAAESVLGNEIDSLKRARRELAALSQQLEEEIRANTSKSQEAGSSGKSSTADGNNDGNEKTNESAGQRGPDGGKGAGADAKPGEGTEPGEGQQPAGEGAQGVGESPGESGAQPAASSGDSQSPQGEAGEGQGSGEGESRPGGQGGGRPAGEQPDPKGSDSQRPSLRQSSANSRSQKPSGSPRPAPGNSQEGGENSEGGGSGGNSQGGGPLTGGDFTEFNERLRDVESMIGDPRLQSEVQKVRDRARSARAEFKRHTTTPNWDFVRSSVHQPMIELQQRLADEIARQESPESLVPVDRDPVPTRYRDLVRGYYERLGTGSEE
ncbi:hypothetical protein [Schlesneria sp. T3-172]|uniref:hypothetical protein n=1 Tax=Schlesneria sphaerica TaxID=3373610 RepID=UPI0037C7B9B4